MRGIQRGITTSFIVFVILAGTIAITSVYLSYFQTKNQKTSEINSFEDCAKLYPVMESYPEQCQVPGGKHFTRELSNKEAQRFSALPKSSPVSHLNIKDKVSYKNIEHNFELKYPQSWSYLLESQGDKTVISFGDLVSTNHIGQKVDPYPAKRVVLEIQSIKQGDSIEKVKNLSLSTNPKWEDAIIAGLAAKKLKHSGCPSGMCQEIIFSDKNKIYDFRIENSDSLDYQNYLSEITSTFKFLK